MPLLTNLHSCLVVKYLHLTLAQAPTATPLPTSLSPSAMPEASAPQDSPLFLELSSPYNLNSEQQFKNHSLWEIFQDLSYRASPLINYM